MAGGESIPKGLRRAALVAGVVVLALGLRAEWLTSDTGFQVRVGLARWRGYDGCLCEDCVEKYGLSPLPWRGGCFVKHPTPPEMAHTTVLAGLAMSGVSLVVPRRRVPDAQ